MANTIQVSHLAQLYQSLALLSPSFFLYIFHKFILSFKLKKQGKPISKSSLLIDVNRYKMSNIQINSPPTLPYKIPPSHKNEEIKESSEKPHKSGNQTNFNEYS